MRTLCVVLALILSGCVSASGASHESPEPVPGASSFTEVAYASGGATMVVVQAVGDTFGRTLDPVRPVVSIPVAPVVDVARGTGGSQGASRSYRGVASWYCGHGSACTRGYPGGLYAAAGPALRTGSWRGRVVEVVGADGRRVRVTLIDTCQCYGSRLLDLYSDVWDALGVPLSRGVMKVTVSW